MRVIDHSSPTGRDALRAAPPSPVHLAVMAALFSLPLAACGSETPPPLTGNLTDSRGAHAGSFLGPDNGPYDARGNATDAINAASPAGPGGNGLTQD